MASPSGPSGPPVSYDPPPNELGYYEGLFAAADIAKTGAIGGRDCVAFLSRSKLPVDILKSIWNMSDANPKTNTLDRKKFFVAIRLIQLSQNGQSAQGPNLSCDPTAILRPPFFDGVTGVTLQPFATAPTAPSPPKGDGSNGEFQHQYQQQQHAPPSPPRPNAGPVPGQPSGNMALTQDPYLMIPGEQVRYESLFPQYEKDGFVYGKEAVELFTKSGLGKEVLRDIWNLVDNPVDNRLSKLEFAIAMHLIVCISKKNLPMPPSIPPSLNALKEKEGGVIGGTNVLGDGGGGIQQQQPLQHPVSPKPMNGTGMPPGVAMSPPRNEPQILQPSLQMGGGPAPPMPSMHQRSFSSGGGNPPGIMSIGSGGAGGGLTMMNISDAFAGMQGDGNTAPPVLPAIKPPEQTSTGAVATSLPSGSSPSSSKEELEKVQSVLQKLQAENISLKAQLGQCSEEEKQVRDEIARTVAEVGTLSQELTSLRSQVVDAKSSLIEASSELKAQVEKRDMLRNLVGETITMRDTIQLGVDAIQGAEASVREAKSRMGSVAPPTSQQQPSVTNPFAYDGQQSVNSGFGADASSYYGGVGGGAASHAPEPAAAQPYYQPPVVPGVPAPSTNDAMYTQPEQQEPSGPSDEALRNLENMKAEAESARREAMSADDHVKALAIQFEDVRADARQAELAASEKQNAKSKKKGLLGGGKKAKKELEAAKQVANEKNNKVQEMFHALKAAEEKAGQLKSNAELLRSQAESYEIQLAEEATSVGPPPAAPAPAPVPMTPQQFGAMVNEQYMASPHLARSNPNAYGADASYGTSYGVGNSSYTNPDPTPMGYGGYAGNPAEMTHQNEPAPMGGAPGANVMGGVASTGNFTDNSSTYGTTSNGSIVYTQGYASDAHSKSSAANLMGGAPAFPTDSSIVGGMSTAGSVGNYSINYTGYTSDVGGQSLVSSKESNPNLAPDPSGHTSHTGGSQSIASNKASNPNLASNDLMLAPGAGLGTVPSKENYGNIQTSSPPRGGDATASSAGLSYGESLNTGVSIGGESNFMPDGSVNNNADISISRSFSNTGTISEYNNDMMPKAEPISQTPHIPPYSFSNAVNQGPIKSQETDYSQFLGMSNDTGGLKTISSNDASEDAFEGIPSPHNNDTAETQVPTNGFTQSLLPSAPETQFAGNGDGKEVANGQIENAMNMMGNLNVNANSFDGIPSPDKVDEQNLNLQKGPMSAEEVNSSNSWTDGIPSPTASYDEYANPFAGTS